MILYFLFYCEQLCTQMYILIDEIVTLSIEIKFVLYIIELGTNKCFNNFD